MRRVIVALAFVLLALPLSALSAAPITFYASLDGPSESPPNASLGIGFTAVTIDAVLHTMTVDVDFSGLTAGNTASHIHIINGPGDAVTTDTLGPVATTTPTFTGFPTGATSGSFTQTFDMTLASSYRAGFITDSGGTTATAEAALFQGIIEGRAYLNIHTSTIPAGEIRGFLAIPEPSTIGLGAIGTAGLLMYRARRRGL